LSHFYLLNLASGGLIKSTATASTIFGAGRLTAGGTSSGTLALTGQAHLQSGTETLSNWSTTRGGSTMSGGFTLTIVADNPAFGSQTLQLTLQNVTKAS